MPKNLIAYSLIAYSLILPAFAHPARDCFARYELVDGGVELTLAVPAGAFQQWIQESLKGAELSNQEVQQGLKPLVEAFFQSKNPLKINGIMTTPVLRDFAIAGPNPYDFVEFQHRKTSISLFYPFAERPLGLSLSWELFSGLDLAMPDSRLPALIVSGKDTVSFDFAPESRTFTWTLPGMTQVGRIEELRIKGAGARLNAPLPAAFLFGVSLALFFLGLLARGALRRRLRISAILTILAALLSSPFGWAPLGWPRPAGDCGLPAPSPEEAKAIFETLHGRIYRAAESKDESGLYEELSKIASGQGLFDLYRDFGKKFPAAEKDGAKCRIMNTAILDARIDFPDKRDASKALFIARCSWAEDVHLEHSGHSHSHLERRRRFAIFKIGPSDGAWKILGMEEPEKNPPDGPAAVGP